MIKRMKEKLRRVVERSRYIYGPRREGYIIFLLEDFDDMDLPT